MFAAAVLSTIALIAILAPLIAPYDPNLQLDITALRNRPPSLRHLFGTDPYSRDVLSRVIHGARISLGIGIFSTFIAMTAGSLYGAIAGYWGGIVDTVMMRIVDALLSIPRVLIVIVIVALWDAQSITLLVLILGGTGWFGVSRLVRGQVLMLREEEYIVAARSLGTRPISIITKHILPNVAPTIIVAATLGVSQIVVLEAGLSFLGLGVQPPDASWGNIIQDGISHISGAWWISILPGICIAVTAIAFNTLGDILRDALEPKRSGQ